MKPTAHVSSLPIDPPILWLPIAALAALYAAFALSWVVYRIHMPSLLTEFGFSPTLGGQLLFVEALLAIILEPLFGYGSDRLERRRQTRFPLIAGGIALSTALMMSMGVWANVVQPDQQWWLPALLLLWAIGMMLFRSPALALVSQWATARFLPLAVACLTIAGGLAGAVNALAQTSIAALGITGAFSLAAVLLGVTGWQLCRAAATHRLTDHVASGLHRSTERSVSFLQMVSILGIGVTTTLALRLAIESFTAVLKALALQPSLFIGVLFLTSLIAAFPVGNLALRWGNRQVFIGGLLILAAAVSGMLLVTHPGGAMGIAILAGAAFSMVSNGSLAFAVLAVPVSPGAAMGVLFGGVGIATCIASGLQANGMSVMVLVGVSVVSALGAIVPVRALSE